MNLDDIFNWQPPEILVKYEAGGPSGFDKEGHPIWIDLSSFTDFTGALLVKHSNSNFCIGILELEPTPTVYCNRWWLNSLFGSAAAARRHFLLSSDGVTNLSATARFDIFFLIIYYAIFF